MGMENAREFMRNLGGVINQNITRFFGGDARYVVVVFKKGHPDNGNFSTNVPKDEVADVLRKTAESIDGADALLNMDTQGEA